MSGFRDKAKNFVVEKIADIPKPKASIEDVGFKKVGRDGVTYNAILGIMNPYSRSVPICEISYVLKSDGRFVFPLLLFLVSLNTLIYFD